MTPTDLKFIRLLHIAMKIRDAENDLFLKRLTYCRKEHNTDLCATCESAETDQCPYQSITTPFWFQELTDSIRAITTIEATSNE